MAQGLRGHLLHVGAQGEAHRAAVVAAAEDAAHLLRGGVAHQHLGLGALELGGTEAIRVVAGDIAEQVAERVHALVLVLVVAGGNALGHHHPIGSDDLAARPVEVADRLAVVLRVGVECFLAHDLGEVQRHEQCQVEHQ